MRYATRWFFALALSSLAPGATQAQAVLSLMRTRIGLIDEIGGTGLFFEAPGTATRPYMFTATIAEADGSSSFLEVDSRASTMASREGPAAASLMVGAASIPTAGHLRQSLARGEVVFGLSYQVRETRFPPFTLLPHRIP